MKSLGEIQWFPKALKWIDGAGIKNNTWVFNFYNQFFSHIITLHDIDLKPCFLLAPLGLEDLR